MDVANRGLAGAVSNPTLDTRLGHGSPWSGGQGRIEWRGHPEPLAVVVMGGLITCTLLTLIVLPTIYVVGHRLVGGPIVAAPN